MDKEGRGEMMEDRTQCLTQQTNCTQIVKPIIKVQKLNN